ncbi:hypothetical protein [Micromonospora peucetia]|uniref:hypothetical protein n=1 Tax=Micromonospora peucetia TaxID=47871 RepID=UPI003CCBF7E0
MPGIRGVGPTTAAALLPDGWHLDELARSPPPTQPPLPRSHRSVGKPARLARRHPPAHRHPATRRPHHRPAHGPAASRSPPPRPPQPLVAPPRPPPGSRSLAAGHASRLQPYRKEDS